MTAHITLVSAERPLPYYRPDLSKSFLKGKTEEPPPFVDAAELHVHEIEWCSGERIEGIDLTAATLTGPGGRLPYDRLLLAPGALARRLPVPGMDLDGVCTLRSLEDAIRLRPRLQESSRIIIIGAGLIGLELAATFRELGLSVTLIEQAERALARTFPAMHARAVIGEHERRGVKFLFNTGVQGFSGVQGQLVAVETTQGTMPTDIAIIAIGAQPDQELARTAGLQCDDGIIVDHYCRTSDANVFAAGDATRIRADGQDARFEAWRHAEAHGRCAGQNLAGGIERYQPAPWFWSDQGHMHLQGAGTMREGAEEVVRIADDGVSRLVFQIDGDLLVAGFALSLDGAIAKELPLLSRLVAAGRSVDRADLADPKITLKSLVRGFT